MANSSTKKGAKKKASKKSAPAARKNIELSKPAFVDIKNGDLHVRYENNQAVTYPLNVIEPELHKFISRAARLENGNIILSVNSFDISLTAARLRALNSPPLSPAKDGLPGRILRVYENMTPFIEKELHKRKWKYTQLCEKTGIKRTTMSNYRSRLNSKNKKSKMPLENFFKILKALNIKLEEL